MGSHEERKFSALAAQQLARVLREEGARHLAERHAVRRARRFPERVPLHVHSACVKNNSQLNAHN